MTASLYCMMPLYCMLLSRPPCRKNLGDARAYARSISRPQLPYAAASARKCALHHVSKRHSPWC